MKPIIEAINILKIYNIPQFLTSKKIKSLNKINIKIYKNEIFSIIGLNGAGKSTLLSIILQIIKPTKGKIKYYLPNFKQKIGYMPEVVNFPLNLSPVDILMSMKNFFPIIDIEKIEKTLLLAGLNNVKNQKLKTFSKGMLQRFNLTQAIIHEPEILILDEPFSGLDPVGRKLFFDIFLEEKSKGKTIIFSSHILTDVEKISDKILILHKGMISKILTSGELNEPLENYFFGIIK